MSPNINGTPSKVTRNSHDGKRKFLWSEGRSKSNSPVTKAVNPTMIIAEEATCMGIKLE
jgi:hypothetical protein